MSHVKTLVLGILDDPHNFQNHVITYELQLSLMTVHCLQVFSSFSSTTMMKVAYGTTTPTSATDPLVGEMHQLMKLVSKVVRPDAYYLVDSIPWLKHIPWYGRELKRGFQRSRRLHVGQLNRVKEQMVCIALPTFT
jgi:hypothetical protein